MFLRSIRNSLGRFLAILAIVALGVGFYAGLKSSQPDMLRSADDYLHRTKMYDFQLLSSLGLSKNDPSELKKIPGIEEAEGACFADAYARAADGAEEVWHFQTLTERVAVPELLAGRLPANDGECLVDSRAFREEDLGSRIVLTDSNSEDILEHFAHTAFTVVGLASSPRYISDNRGTSELGSGKPAGFVLLPASAFTDDAYHEILLWCDLPGTIYSEEYSDALRHMRPAVETMLNRRSVLRARQLREENSEALIKARKELDDGWSEYRLGLQTSAQELADGKQQLEAAELQLEVGRAALEQSEKLLAEQEGELENLRKSKQEKQAELNSLLDLQKTALSDLLTAQLQLEAHKAALAAQQIQLPDIPENITLDPAVTDALSRLGIDIDLSEINNELSNIQDALEQAGNSAAGINIDEEEAALSRQQEDYLDLVKKIASLELELLFL